MEVAPTTSSIVGSLGNTDGHRYNGEVPEPDSKLNHPNIWIPGVREKEQVCKIKLEGH